MKVRLNPTRIATLLPLAALLACFEDPVVNTTAAEGETTGDGDGDTTGDGDGDTTGDGDGDTTGDGDGDTMGDGDGDTMGDGDGDTMGDGDGDTGIPECGDGQVDPGELCLVETPDEYPVGQSAVRLAAGKFDVDAVGVAVAGGTSDLSILRGDGNGGLLAPELVAASSTAHAVDTDDIDNDGDIDVAASGGGITVLRNDGNGGWADVKVGDTFAFQLYPISIGQIDGNAALDLVVAEGYNTLWFRGSTQNGWSVGLDGSAQFTGGDSWVFLTELGSDGDGFTDMLVASRWSPDVAVARGQGNGTFMQTGQVEVCEQGACDIHELHAADLDGDENPDIVASFASGFSVMMGKDDGTFAPYELHASPGADHIDSGDIDNDGDIDLVVASRDDGDLRLFLGDGAGGLADPIILDVPGPDTRTVEMVDLDEDGALEIITAYDFNGGGWVAVFPSDP